MSNIYDEQEDSMESVNPRVRKDTLKDVLSRGLWQIVGYEEIHKETFTMRDAREFFENMLGRRPYSEQMEDTCVLFVERMDDHYVIKQILMDKNGNFVRQTTKSYYGREITAKYVDESVITYMKGETVRIMGNPNQY